MNQQAQDIAVEQSDNRIDLNETVTGRELLAILFFLGFFSWAGWQVWDGFVRPFFSAESTQSTDAEAEAMRAAAAAHEAAEKRRKEIANEQRVIKEIGEYMVSKNLRSPSTASWASTNIVAQKPPYYVVHVVVDAQNAFGGVIRNSFLTAFKLLDASKGSYSSAPFSAMVKSHNPPRPTEINAMKRANWPDE